VEVPTEEEEDNLFPAAWAEEECGFFYQCPMAVVAVWKKEHVLMKLMWMTMEDHFDFATVVVVVAAAAAAAFAAVPPIFEIFDILETPSSPFLLQPFAPGWSSIHWDVA
jgi:hypothetical protein